MGRNRTTNSSTNDQLQLPTLDRNIVNNPQRDETCLPLRQQISIRTRESGMLLKKDERLLYALEQLSQRATLRNDVDHSRDLYQHQSDALGVIWQKLELGKTTGYIKHPCATGKTVLMGRFLSITGLPALIIEPTLDLCNQVYRELRTDFPSLDLGVKTRLGRHRVTITTSATALSLFKNGLLDTSLFDILIADEAHLILGKNRQKMVAALKEEIPIVGFTATDRYYSNKSLIPLLGNPWHTLTIQEAVDDGLIPPHHSLILRTDLDLSSVEIKKGNYNRSQLARAIRVSSSVQGSLDLYRNSFSGLTAIVSCGLNDEAKLWADAFNGAGISAATIKGEMGIDERKKILASVNSGETKVLCGSDLVVTGLDIPRASVIFNTPTCSAVVAEQRLGRVQRKDPENPEKISYSVDILPFKESRSRGCILVPDVLDGKVLLERTKNGKSDKRYEVKKIDRLFEGAGVLSSVLEIEPIIKERKAAFGIGRFVNGALISYPEQSKILSEMKGLAEVIVNATCRNPIILLSALAAASRHSEIAAGLLTIFEHAVDKMFEQAVDGETEWVPKIVTSTLFDTRSELYQGVLRLDEAAHRILEEDKAEDPKCVLELRNNIRLLLDKVWYLFHAFEPAIKTAIRDYSTSIRGPEERTLRKGLEEVLLSSINYLPLQDAEYFDRGLIKAIKDSIGPLLKLSQSKLEVSPLPSDPELHLPCTHDLNEIDRTDQIEHIRALHAKFLTQQESIRDLKAAELLFADDPSASLKGYCDEMNYGLAHGSNMFRMIRDRFISFGQECIVADEKYQHQFPLPYEYSTMLQELYEFSFSNAILEPGRAKAKKWTEIINSEALIANPEYSWRGFTSLLRETSPCSTQRKEGLREIEYLLSGGYCVREKIVVSRIPNEFSYADLYYAIDCGINFSTFALVDFGLRNALTVDTILPFMDSEQRQYLLEVAEYFCMNIRLKSDSPSGDRPMKGGEFLDCLFNQNGKPWASDVWSNFTEPKKVGPSLFVAVLCLGAKPGRYSHKKYTSKHIRISPSKDSHPILARIDRQQSAIATLRAAGYSESFIEVFNSAFLEKPSSFTPQREGYSRLVREELYFNYLEFPKSTQEHEGKRP